MTLVSCVGWIKGGRWGGGGESWWIGEKGGGRSGSGSGVFLSVDSITVVMGVEAERWSGCRSRVVDGRLIYLS